MQDTSCKTQEWSCTLGVVPTLATTDSATEPTIVRAPLGFVRPEHVSTDDTRPGLLRAKTLVDPPPVEELDMRECAVRDLADGAFVPSLTEHGFTTVRLPDRAGLHSHLESVRRRGALDDADEGRIRRSLRRARIPLADGAQLLVLHVADEGMIFRAAGPDAIAVDGSGLADEHGGAQAVHADQDVGGTPVRQILRGLAPRVFRHDAPDSSNRRSPLQLVNLWLPLQQVTRPLALLDGSTVDRPSQQLRYELPVDDILGRTDASRAVNDIWRFVHDDRQRWWFHSAPELGQAHVFDTLSTPHGSFVLPGEDLAAERYRRIDRAITAIEAGAGFLDEATTPEGPVTAATEGLREAIEEMDASLDVLCAADGGSVAAAAARARTAQRAVVRMSIEMRAVVLRIPPLRRPTRV